jgi:hypothetical protein
VTADGGEGGEGGEGVVRVAVWSGPRNISTALMRSWENRSDTVVVDEPLYAYYLVATGLDHPGRDEVIAAGETDWRAVVATLVGPVQSGGGGGGKQVFYQKHMAHHLLPAVDRGWIAGLDNLLLIRDPGEVVASFVRGWPGGVGRLRAADIGLPQQVDLYDELHAAGAPPLVVDAADLLGDPERHLRAWCALLGLAFTDRMLSWPPGPRPSDGVWAPHWYASVHGSTGFTPHRPRHVRLDGRAAAVAAEVRPLYERLHALRWRP